MRAELRGVARTAHRPPKSFLSASKATHIFCSIFRRSAAVIAPGSGKSARLRPTRTRIESAGRPSFERSSTPSAGIPSPASDQSVTCFVPRGTLWYAAITREKKGPYLS